MVKKYRLLKDLPFAKAGAIFQEWTTKRNEKEEKALVNADNLTTTLWSKDIDNFDDWFEEIQELKKYYYIGSMGHIESAEYKGWEVSLKLRKSIGNYFETREEAEKHLTYLKAKAIIKEDTKGFTPDWDTNKEPKYIEPKYIGSYGGLPEKPTLNWNVIYTHTYSTICFRTLEDIMDSFKKHPEEWKAYLLYNQ